MSPNLDTEFFRLLSDSYRRFVGKPLVPEGLAPSEAAAWLYESAPFGLIAHDTAPDPVFVYGNLRAQRIFGYDWDELIRLPSRLSAGPMERDARQAFLDRVARDGFVDDYRGLRVAKSGARFWVERVTVWQLVDGQGRHRGQAAMIPEVTPASE